ncbi:MAG: hypothetical protein J7K54_01960 [Candidatus Aenigmarchaeota archaeon]|nr:hypothetical protein [Candidatus Aenigmarchaeota archaeon]
MSLFNLRQEEIEAYCVRCRKTVLMKNIEDYEMKNGKKAWKGTCSECGAVLFRIKPAPREGMW